MKKICFITGALLILFTGCTKKISNHQDEISVKVDSLLARMTLEEKIGQMTQLCFSTITLNGTKELDLNPGLFREAIVDYHVGSFISGTGPVDKWASFVTSVQEIAVRETRLGIPLLIGIDHVHGANYVDEGTFLPHNITLSCGFDTGLVATAARITADESGALGLSWNFAPVLDIARNPYWPRFYETFGEDPYLCGHLGKAFIQEYQNGNSQGGFNLAACAKHFIGYSNPASGWDRTPAEISLQTLRDQYIPPFREAIEGGVKSVMLNSGELNGRPVHASKDIVQGLLREELGFDGVIITDIKDIVKIVEEHHAASDEKEATLMAIEAGIDINMACNAYYFCDIMKDLVEERKISRERIDQSVRRILRMKFELGLFDNPYPDELPGEYFNRPENLEKARAMAGECMVLMKNETLLPLSDRSRKIMVTGIAADSKKMLNGAWTLEWLGAEESRQPAGMHTISSALKEVYGEKNVWNVPLPEEGKVRAIEDFQKLAAEADVIVFTAGEEPYSEFKGNINDLALPGNQAEMIRIASLTGTPVVLVLIEGRPRLITDIEKNVNAIIFAGIPGIEGGRAIADVISGKVSPSGKLSFTYPKYPGHNIPYNHKPTDKSTGLYPFGYGLSYTNFDYSAFSVSDTLVHEATQKLIASLTVTNSGKMEGKEIVLWYITDMEGTYTRPVKMLKHFEKINLKPGESKMVKFEFSPAEVLSYPGEDGTKMLESGRFMIHAGNITREIYFDGGIK